MMDGAQPFALSVGDLDRRLAAGEELRILDVREPWELEICRLRDSLAIPLALLPDRLDELPRSGLLVVLCHHGMRSAHAVRWLQSNGFANAVNLDGGIDAWAQQIDRTMRTY